MVGVPAETGLDKEFVVGSTYQKWYVDKENDFSPGKIPLHSCRRKDTCVLEMVVLRVCCLMARFGGRVGQ